MIIWIAKKITFWITKRLMAAFGFDRLRADRWAGVLFKGGAVLVIAVALIGAGYWVQGCWIDRKVEVTNRAIDKLKVEEAKIEAEVEAYYGDAERKEGEAEIAEKKAEILQKKSDAAVKAAKEIAKETGVSIERAKTNMCLAYPEGCK